MLHIPLGMSLIGLFLILSFLRAVISKSSLGKICHRIKCSKCTCTCIHRQHTLTLRLLKETLRLVRVRERGERLGRVKRKWAFRLSLYPPSNILSSMATSEGDIRGWPPLSALCVDEHTCIIIILPINSTLYHIILHISTAPSIYQQVL